MSGARIRDELMDLLRETDAPAAIERMRDLEIHSALHPELDPDPELVASAALGAAAIGADRGVSALAALVESAPEELDLWLADLHLPAEERDAASRAARVAPRIAQALREREHTPSELRELLGPGAARGAGAGARAARAVGADPPLGHRPARRGARHLRRRTCWRRACPRARPWAARSRRRSGASSTGSCPGASEELETALQLAGEHAQ